MFVPKGSICKRTGRFVRQRTNVLPKKVETSTGMLTLGRPNAPKPASPRLPYPYPPRPLNPYPLNPSLDYSRAIRDSS
jgi:hypothetical protein